MKVERVGEAGGHRPGEYPLHCKWCDRAISSTPESPGRSISTKRMFQRQFSLRSDLAGIQPSLSGLMHL